MTDTGKVGAKAPPLVTHVPDALEHGVEIRADSMVIRVEAGETGTCTGVTYVRDGRERLQRASAVCVAGYSIESPRLLLSSGIGNGDDQVGRYVMVQGAPQVAGRFPETLRMYKGPCVASARAPERLAKGQPAHLYRQLAARSEDHSTFVSRRLLGLGLDAADEGDQDHAARDVAHHRDGGVAQEVDPVRVGRPGGNPEEDLAEAHDGVVQTGSEQRSRRPAR